MNTLKNKENVILGYQKQIEGYNVLIYAMEYCKKFIKTFDNKVLNKRLLTAISKDFTDNNVRFTLGELYSGSETMVLSIFLCGSYRYYQLNGKMCGTQYINCDTADFKIVTNQDNRIQADETIKVINERIDYLSKQTEKYRNAIVNYDRYVEMNKELIQYIKAYRENVNQLHQISNLPYIYNYD